MAFLTKNGDRLSFTPTINIAMFEKNSTTIATEVLSAQGTSIGKYVLTMIQYAIINHIIIVTFIK